MNYYKTGKNSVRITIYQAVGCRNNEKSLTKCANRREFSGNRKGCFKPKYTAFLAFTVDLKDIQKLLFENKRLFLYSSFYSNMSVTFKNDQSEFSTHCDLSEKHAHKMTCIRLCTIQRTAKFHGLLFWSNYCHDLFQNAMGYFVSATDIRTCPQSNHY